MKKQGIRCDGVIPRTGSLHPKVLLLIGIIVCHQARIDAFSTGLARCFSGKISQRTFYQGPTRVPCPLSTPTNEFALQGFFGGIFGGEDAARDGKDGLLATYDIKLSDAADLTVKYESLSDFITNKWATLFVNGSIKLTTPVRVSMNENTEDSNAAAGCRLIFEKVDTGYKSKKEDVPDAGDSESAPSEKKETKQGGVDISILPPSDTNASLQVRVTRCEIDDDTVIKEMSEETVLKELRKAIDIWQKETPP